MKKRIINHKSVVSGNIGKPTMPITIFYKNFYRRRESTTSEAARLVLVQGYKQSYACECTGANKGAVFRFIKELTDPIKPSRN